MDEAHKYLIKNIDNLQVHVKELRRALKPGEEKEWTGILTEGTKRLQVKGLLSVKDLGAVGKPATAKPAPKPAAKVEPKPAPKVEAKPEPKTEPVFIAPEKDKPKGKPDTEPNANVKAKIEAIEVKPKEAAPAESKPAKKRRKIN